MLDSEVRQREISLWKLKKRKAHIILLPREVFIQDQVTAKLQQQYLNSQLAVGYKSKSKSTEI